MAWADPNDPAATPQGPPRADDPAAAPPENLDEGEGGDGAGEPPQPQPDPAELERQRQFEAEARATGWVPESEWRGDPPPGGLKSAQEWVENSRYVKPVARSVVEPLQRENEALKQRLAAIEQRMGQSAEHQLQADVDQIRARARELRKQAFEAGDFDSMEDIAERADRAIAQLTEEARRAQAQQPQPAPGGDANAQQAQIAQQIDGWRAANPDVGHNAVRWAATEAMARTVLQEPAFAGQSPDVVLNEAARRVRSEFPTSHQPSPAPFVGVNTRGVAAPQKTWQDLPDEVKQIARRARNTAGYRDKSDQQFRESYASDYWRGKEES